MTALISVIGPPFSSAQNQKPGSSQICKYHVGLCPEIFFSMKKQTKTKYKKTKTKKGEGDEGKMTFGKRDKIEFSFENRPSQREGQQQN